MISARTFILSNVQCLLLTSFNDVPNKWQSQVCRYDSPISPSELLKISLQTRICSLIMRVIQWSMYVHRILRNLSSIVTKRIMVVCLRTIYLFIYLFYSRIVDLKTNWWPKPRLLKLHLCLDSCASSSVRVLNSPHSVGRSQSSTPASQTTLAEGSANCSKFHIPENVNNNLICRWGVTKSDLMTRGSQRVREF